MTVRQAGDQSDTRTAILDVAERLVQSRGFNGFSYADIAAELGITTSALHYHFRGKSELGEAVIARYATHFLEAMASIDAQATDGMAKLWAYADLYLGMIRNERMCLCGMLAAEYQTLPDPMRQSVVRFFDDNHLWLTRLLDAGRSEGTIAFSGTAHGTAEMIVGTLEGTMLVACSYGGAARFESMTARLMAEFMTSGSRSRSARHPRAAFPPRNG